MGSTIIKNSYKNEYKNVEHFGYYIPLKESLENLLNVVPLKSLNLSSKSSVDLITDIFDGEEIKNKLKNNDSLALTFYVDDAEVVNPIGAHTKKHKLSKHFLIIQYYIHLGFSFSIILLGSSEY